MTFEEIIDSQQHNDLSLHFEEWVHMNNEILYNGEINETVQIQVALALLAGMLGLFLATTFAWIYYRSPISRFYDIKQSFSHFNHSGSDGGNGISRKYQFDTPFTPMTKELELKIRR